MMPNNKQTWILIAIILAFVLVQSIFIHPSFSDETFYFNTGRYISNGVVPYKDFFFAHPPLQPYMLAVVFKIFGPSFWVAKVISLLSASLCVLLTYLMSKELSSELKNNKASIISALIFLVTPGFIAFSTMGHGMWEASFLVLVSAYILIKNNNKKDFKTSEMFAALVFTFAVFFRYIALLYFPFLILLLNVRKIKFKKFAFVTPLFCILFFVVCLLIFGQNYIDQTVNYHMFSKVSLVAPSNQKMQYWGLGFFSIFLALLSLGVAYTEKDKTLFFLAVTAISVDIIMLIVLKLVFYHYFIISLTFYSIAAARAFAISKDRLIKMMIPIVLALSIFSNFQTIDFYLNPSYANRFYEITEFVENESLGEETIFGEPVLTNYVSFVTGRRIAGNYLDSYMRHLVFEGTAGIVEKIRADSPRILIEMDSYYISDPNFRPLFNEYGLEIQMFGIPNYFIYKR